ncbi:MAG: hypothetical protein JW892_03500 [Anaerolineae bacterium]|nr:hypothetical protein [Anaerolineae bacterium]
MTTYQPLKHQTTSAARAFGESRSIQRILRGGGALFGIVYGLCFALFLWGRDGLLLAQSAAEWPWLSLILGLPTALLIGGIAGWVATLSSSAAWSVVVWVFANAALGWLAGHLPCEGVSFAIGFLDPRVSGLELIPFTPYHETALWVVIGGLALIGLALGLAQPYAIEAFWDRLGSEARAKSRGLRLFLNFKVLPLVLWGAPLALISAVVAILMFSSYRIAPPRQVHHLIQTTLAGGEARVQAEGLNQYAAQRYGARFTPVYVQHFNHPYRATDTVHTIYVDTAFDNGFVMRCCVVSGTLSSCDDVSALYPVWMESLVAGGRAGTQPWKELPQELRVGAEVEAILAQGKDALAGDFSVHRAVQHGGVLWLEARFTSGAALTCRFRGLYPVMVEACEVTRP